MFELKEYIEKFSNLHTAKVKGHKAPHKAVLLLAIIDLVEERNILSPRIHLSEELIDRFNIVWHRYLGTSTIFTPDVTKPFFHMQYESFWGLVNKKEVLKMKVTEDSSWIYANKQKKELPTGSYSVKAMRQAFEYAEIDARLFILLQNADARAMLRVILINKYLVNQPTKTMPDIGITMFAFLPLILLAG